MRCWTDMENYDADRGLGLYYVYKCIGSSYGQKGWDWILFLTVLLFRWKLNVRFSWKSNA